MAQVKNRRVARRLNNLVCGMNDLHGGSVGKTYFQGNHFLLKPAAADLLTEQPTCCPESGSLLKGKMEIARGESSRVPEGWN
jgi:hypothetical protein